MEKSKVNLLLVRFQDYLPAETLKNVGQALDQLPDDYFTVLSSLEMKDPTTSTILAFFGIGRFYLDQVGKNLLQIFTFYGFGFWWLIDLFTIAKDTRAKNHDKLVSSLMLLER
jgi:hypothetical protein